MNFSVDLHIHSTASDGMLSPSGIVLAAKKLGLAGLSLTDHDTIQGLDEFMKAGASEGLDTVSGIEISSYFGEKPLHILGYGFDWRHPALAVQLDQLQRIREDRNRKIRNRFKALGITISDKDLAKVSDGQIGRPHFARVLCQKGVVATQEEAFIKFLRKGALAYAAKEKFPAASAIQAIRQAGGIAVLAHPWCVDHTLATIPLLLNRLQDLGLEGIEVYYPAHSTNVRQRLLEMTHRYRLLATGGSDFHGTTHSPRLAGDRHCSFRVPIEVLRQLRERLQEHGNDRIPLTVTR